MLAMGLLKMEFMYLLVLPFIVHLFSLFFTFLFFFPALFFFYNISLLLITTPPNDGSQTIPLVGFDHDSVNLHCRFILPVSKVQ